MSAQSELLQDFLIESFENLNLVNDDLKKLSENQVEYEVINSIYRAVHTLKGAANLLNFTKLQDITHSVENLLDYMRSDKIKASRKVVDLLQRFFDICNDCLKHIEQTGEESSKIDFTSIKEEVLYIIENELASGVETNLKDSYFQESDSELVKNKESNYENDVESKLYVASDVSDAIPNVIPIQESIENHFKEPSYQEKNIVETFAAPVEEVIHDDGVPIKNITDTSIRVNVHLLDKIMNLVGELVLNRNQILQCVSSLREPELDRLTQQLNVITTELQSDIMTTRMQPIGNILNKFERMVRDFSRESGKRIKFRIVGHDTELDKSLLESIKDPLTHIIRNSIDHGIETSDERLVAGKLEEGNLVVRAYHESGQVTIEISDDGRGIDLEKVKHKAIEKQLVSIEKINTMSDEEILKLVFKPGFSTAEKVTKISGRGVGMDVVKTNIEKIGGSVSISSNLGSGTEIKLKIPLTLAIVPALIIQGRNELFAIPQINIVELVRLEGEKNSSIEHIDSSEFIRLRGNLIPVFRINKTLDLIKVSEKSAQFHYLLENNADQINYYQKQNNFEADSINIVILNAEGTQFGIIVDAIMDTEEIVVKPLDRNLKDLTYFAGATIMGNGHVALIIDAIGFYNGHDKESIADHLKTKDLSVSSVIDTTETSENLLVKLSDDRIYGIPLSIIYRLEEFKISQLEKVGQQTIVRYDEKAMLIIDLENSLGLSKTSVLSSKNSETTVKAIVVKLHNYSYGFIVKSIIDIATSSSKIDSDIVDREGLLGAIFIDDQIVTIIDIFSVIESLDFNKKSKAETAAQFKLVSSKGVLIVDDSPVYRKMEENLFREHGFKIHIANNGEDGLRVLKENLADIDIVVTDIEMPIMDGFEFARSIKQSSQFKHLPVVAVSSRVTEKYINLGKEAGFNAHLEKFKKYDVLDAVYTNLGVKI